MTTPATDFFGDEHISIPNNDYLAKICDHILAIKKRVPNLISGDSVGEIDDKVTLAVWFDEGLGDFIPEDKQEAFTKWFSQTKLPPQDAISRALRHLREHDIIRYPETTVKKGEAHKVRIAQSFKHK